VGQKGGGQNYCKGEDNKVEDDHKVEDVNKLKDGSKKLVVW